MKVKVEIPKRAAKLVRALHRSGLFGITIEDTVRYMVFKELERQIAKGGLLLQVKNEERKI